MVKNNKLSRLMTKMNLRTILKSKLQFVAVIFITAIAMTLYVGLTSNAKSIQNRVNELYQESNMADIWVTTSNFDGNDYYEIKDLVGINGKVESRFALPAKLQSYSATALLSEELPTICAPANTDNTAEKDFLRSSIEKDLHVFDEKNVEYTYIYCKDKKKKLAHVFHLNIIEENAIKLNKREDMFIKEIINQ